MQGQAGQYAREDVIEHNAEASPDSRVCHTNGPRFDDIEDSEGHETGNNPQPLVWNRPHSDPVARELIPYDAGVIMGLQLPARNATNPDAENDRCKHHKGVLPERQPGKQKVKRYRENGAYGAGRLGRQAAAKTKRQELRRAAQQARARRFAVRIGLHDRVL